MFRLFLLFLFCIQPAFAHKASDSFLSIDSTKQSLNIQWQIALRDLENVLALDDNLDGQIDWSELRNNQENILHYAKSNLSILAVTNECHITANDLKVSKHSDGLYAVLYLSADCLETNDEMTISYDLFFEVDKQHRGLLKFSNRDQEISYVFSPENPEFSVSPTRFHTWETFVLYVQEGIWHIWIGFDHILFLISLLLPSVLIWQHKQWSAATNLTTVFIDVIKIVTGFTLAHSASLCFVVLSGFSPPVTLTEVVIAISVIYVSINNIYPLFSSNRWLLAMGFGLIHGFGFANVLQELALSSGSLTLGLLSFNLGVEIGQLLIVALFIPIIYLLRNKTFYRRVVRYSSILIAGMGIVWVIERSA